MSSMSRPAGNCFLATHRTSLSLSLRIHLPGPVHLKRNIVYLEQNLLSLQKKSAIKGISDIIVFKYTLSFLAAENHRFVIATLA